MIYNILMFLCLILLGFCFPMKFSIYKLIIHSILLTLIIIFSGLYIKDNIIKDNIKHGVMNENGEWKPEFKLIEDK